ncbi:amino acid permease [Streptomyces filipinensis]|uniref:Amino acid permease n=1 Tax=Streptomyces filipinensis TaxID=66887 RepID=A0A918IHU6_9ACTN|nr:APC family permease [Streptomyces filipinensis]GGV19607.1 amino acid permease [Streptomyces filipinensis]
MSHTSCAPPPAPGQLTATLTTPKIVFLIIAAAAPLAAMVATVPLAFALGNGPGVPALFVFAGLTLMCFCVGYAAISRRVVNAGGFYTYISCGLGRPPAVAAGLIATLAYNTASTGLLGSFAYFTHLIAAQHGISLPWQLWAAAGLLAIAVLGYRQIDLSVRVLGVAMCCEVGILLILAAAVLLRHGHHALPATSFSTHTLSHPGIGVTMMFAFISFIGIESAALYGEESRHPERSVARATYIAISLIALFYGFISWIAVGAVGPGHIRAVAGQELGDLFFRLSDDYLTSTLTSLMQILLCLSLFAGWLALHNAANRYMFVLGRERILPSALGTVHPRHASPFRASLAQTLFSLLLATVFALAGLDPYLGLTTSMLGIGTLGIVLLQAVACLSVIGYFRRRPDRHWWRTTLAPALGFLGLAAATFLVVDNFATMTGTDNPVVGLLPWLILAVAAAGIAYALWLRQARPARYARLAGVHTRQENTTPARHEPARHTEPTELLEHTEHPEHAEHAGQAEHPEHAEHAGQAEHAGHAGQGGHAGQAGQGEPAERAAHAGRSEPAEHGEPAEHAGHGEPAGAAGQAGRTVPGRATARR